MKLISFVFSFKNEETNLSELIKRVDDSVKKLFFDEDYLIGKFLATDLFDKATGIINFEAGDEISESTLQFFASHFAITTFC